MSLITPFERPAIVMEKVTRDELLRKLRVRINKHYMPSAVGNIQFNSKPEYVRRRLLSEPDQFWPSVGPSDWTGYYAFDQFGAGGDTPKAIYLFIRVEPISILVQLTTEDVMVAQDTPRESLAYFPWSKAEDAVAIDRIILEDVLDTYV